MAESNKPLDPADMRAWCRRTTRRIKKVEMTVGASLGLPFPVRVRTEGPLSKEELEAKMIRNGATPEEAAERTAQILKYRSAA